MVLLSGLVLLSACTAGTAAQPVARQTLPPLATRTAEPAAAGVQGLGPLDDGQTVTITVEPGDEAWLLGLQAPAPDELVGISQVTDPTGTVRYLADLHDDVIAIDELHPRVLADAGALGLYVASSPDEPLMPGDWRVRVAGNAGIAAANLARVHGPVDGVRTLDLAVWVTAEGGAGEQLAEDWRAGLDALLSPHDMRIGALDVTVAGESGTRFRLLGVDGLATGVHEACSAAAQATAAAPTTAVVIVTDRIAEGVTVAGEGGADAAVYRRPDGTVAGFAASSPGTPVVGPASHACVVVAVDREQATADPVVALHELLHVAGLTRHTTESDGQVFDRFADTPECPGRSHDANQDGTVDRTECEGGGAGNVMFWAAGGTELSDEQAWRVRRHPLLR